jgi:hypothetical protein
LVAHDAKIADHAAAAGRDLFLRRGTTCSLVVS